MTDFFVYFSAKDVPVFEKLYGELFKRILELDL